MQRKFYSIPEAAKICLFSNTTVWRWVTSGKIKSFVTPGGQYRIFKEDLETFMIDKGMSPLLKEKPIKNKVLIVDDDPSMQKLLAKILETYGYQTEAATDGFEAGIKITRFNPDLIFLDLFMPNMNGFETCRRIKNDPETKNIKVLILTGYDSQENRDRIMNEGADDYLSKPVVKDVLLKCVQSLLKHKEIVIHSAINNCVSFY